MTTVAPILARPRAVALPIPELAPVTRQILPFIGIYQPPLAPPRLGEKGKNRGTSFDKLRTGPKPPAGGILPLLIKGGFTLTVTSPVKGEVGS